MSFPLFIIFSSAVFLVEQWIFALIAAALWSTIGAFFLFNIPSAPQTLAGAAAGYLVGLLLFSAPFVRNLRTTKRLPPRSVRNLERDNTGLIAARLRWGWTDTVAFAYGRYSADVAMSMFEAFLRLFVITLSLFHVNDISRPSRFPVGVWRSWVFYILLALAYYYVSRARTMITKDVQKDAHKRDMEPAYRIDRRYLVWASFTTLSFFTYFVLIQL